jgi:hypothetical protein
MLAMRVVAATIAWFATQFSKEAEKGYSALLSAAILTGMKRGTPAPTGEHAPRPSMVLGGMRVLTPPYGRIRDKNLQVISL